MTDLFFKNSIQYKFTDKKIDILEIHKQIIENRDFKKLHEVSKIEDLVTIIENHNSDLKKMETY